MKKFVTSRQVFMRNKLLQLFVRTKLSLIINREWLFGNSTWAKEADLERDDEPWLGFRG